MSSFEALNGRSGATAFEPHAGAAAQPAFLPAGDVPAIESGAEAREPAPPTVEEQLHAAREEGLSAGRSELPWAEAEELRSAVEACQSAARMIAERNRSNLVEHRQAVLDLACAMADRIVRRELGSKPEALLGFVDRALAELAPSGAVRVLLNEADLAAVRRDAGLERFDSAEIELEADGDLQPGDVQIDAGATRIDGRVASMLSAIRSSLEDLTTQEVDEP